MKCDELKAETIVPQGCTITLQMYPKAEVDAAIAELKAKLEDVQASHYAEMVDAGMRERRLRRALWLARAERAMAEVYSVLNDVPTSNRWIKAMDRLTTKAEEYKR